MTPQFQFLTSLSPPVFNDKTTQSLLAEVLRCHSYLDETVFLNTIKLLSNTDTAGKRADGLRLAKTRYISIVFHSIKDDQHRKSLKDLAEKVENCKIPMFRNEQSLFQNSMQSSDSIPNFTKCMHKSDLILCYFRRELKSMNWENIRKLLNLYPKHCLLYDHIDKFIETAKKRNIKPQEIVEALMQFSQANNPYYIEKSDFEMLLKKSILSSCTNVTKTMFTRNNTEKSFISSKDVELLKRKIDEYVHNSKEGYVKSKEYGKVRTKVSEWRKEKKVKDGENLVVVDALNYGIGQDRKEWNSISKQFRHVVFATRFPPMPIRDEVIKRYNGNALFCDKLSADDLIILRMAIEFGRQTSLVTNDQYRDHRRAVCNGDLDVEKVWDDFLIDAVYRHKDGNIETHRNFNLRVHKVNGHWILPVLDSEGNSDKIRDLKVFRIALA